jgi:O-antigen/teichoic acid export membrane protein
VSETVSVGSIRRLIKNAAWLLGANGVGVILSFATGLLVARILGPAQYGMLAVITTYVRVVNQFLGFRTWEGVIKYVAEFMVKQEDAKALATIKLGYGVDVATGLLSLLVVVSSAPLAVRWFAGGQSGASSLLTLYALSLLFSSLDGPSIAVLRTFDRFPTLSMWTTIGAVLRLGSIAGIWVLGLGLREVVLSYLTVAAVVSIGQGWMALNEVRARLGHVRREAGLDRLDHHWREMVRFGLNTKVSGTLSTINKYLDVLILGYFRLPAEVGYYKLAKSLASMLSAIGDPINVAVYPDIARLHVQGARAVRGFVRKLAGLLAAVIVPFVLILEFAAPILVTLVGGADFTPSTTAFRLIIVGFAFRVVFNWLRPVALAANRPELPTKVNVGVALEQVLLSLLLVPSFGYLDSAGIQSVLNVSGNLALLHMLRSELYPNGLRKKIPAGLSRWSR